MLDNLLNEIIERNTSIVIIGLGYVGLPIAISFSKHFSVIGFDRNIEKVEEYKKGNDLTGEVGKKVLEESNIFFTSDELAISKAKVFIVAVPTPINNDYTPDLSCLIDACNTIGRILGTGSIVIFESTVYPGVTEEVCIPIIEACSRLKCGVDFKVGYSPERINPGDEFHTFESIRKIVSGIDDETKVFVSELYKLVVKAGIYQVSSIKIAEAAKVIENTQRDINIALMNELSIMFHKMDIDTNEVIEAASTKWNFMKFVPGLVGGHCVGIDPYYLTYKAEMLGYHSQVILSGRRINDGMSKYVAENAIKLLIRVKKSVNDIRAAILGVTFKENCSDVRNSKVFDIVEELKEYGVTPLLFDPIADEKQVDTIYGIHLNSIEEIVNMDLIIVAVAHECFCNIERNVFNSFFSEGGVVLMDLKKCLDQEICKHEGILYWSL